MNGMYQGKGGLTGKLHFCALLLSLIVLAGTAHAVDNLGLFERDANVNNSPAVVGEDWDNVCFSSIGAPNGTSSSEYSFVYDDTALSDSTDTSILHVIPSGTLPPNPLELLSPNKFKERLHDLQKNYEVKIVDSEFRTVMHHAAETGPWEPGVQLQISQKGWMTC